MDADLIPKCRDTGPFHAERKISHSQRSAARETRTPVGWTAPNSDAPESAADGTAADTFTFMSEINFDWRTQPVLRMLLTAAIVISAVALAVAIVIAVLVDMQSDYLSARSEQGGLFDPSVFPPGNWGLWLIGNTFPILLAILLGMLIAARIVAGTGHDRLRTIDEHVVMPGH